MGRTAEVVVVGAGLAGAATAFFLSLAGCRDVLVLEREPLPGMHASGRNAAMLVTPHVSAGLDPMAEESRRFFLAPPPPFAGPLLRRTGSLLTGRGPEWWRLRTDPRGQAITPEEARARVPALDPAALEGALWSPEDGVIDVHALLSGYLVGARRGGARVETGVGVLGLRASGGRIAGVETSAGPVQAPVVVNAAGARAGELGAAADLALPLTPFRRHLGASVPSEAVDPGWPIVWDLSDPFYCRPESGGLLMSPCDEEPHPPGEVLPTATGAEQIALKTSRLLPGLSGLRLGRVWACLRTFAADRAPVVGPDPRVQGLYWVAGLGGQGVSLSPAVGRLAARLIHGEPPGSSPMGTLSPARLLEPVGLP